MMQLPSLEVPVWNTGLVLELFLDGSVVVWRSIYFIPLIDLPPDANGVEGNFGVDGFWLKDRFGATYGMDYGVAYPYKEMPAFKEWLVQQKLEF